MAISFPRLRRSNRSPISVPGGVALDTEKAEALFKRFLDSPAGRQLAADEALGVYERRVALVAELAAVQRNADEHSVELAKELETKHKVYDRLKEQLEAARADVAVSLNRNFAEVHRVGALTDPLEKELRALAPSSIGDFIADELWELRAVLSRIDPIEATMGGVYSAAESLGDRLRQVQALGLEAEALKLAPLPDAEIDDRLQQLRDRARLLAPGTTRLEAVRLSDEIGRAITRGRK